MESEPARAFGYVIGDEIPLVNVVTLPQGCRFLTESLPKPGAFDYWLDLKHARLEGAEGPVARIERTYQIFYAPLEVKGLSVPGVNLTMQCGGERRPLELPAWEFSAAPLRGLRVEGLHTLRPDRVPAELSVVPAALALTGSLLLALASGLRWTWLAGWWPQAGVFARAGAELGRLGAGPWDTAAVKHACAIVHRAFNRYAGQPVFAERLDAFFAERQAWEPRRADIEDFYKFSYAVHFDEDAVDSDGTLPGRLKDLLAACARLELAE
ncbi:hypothetical protein [Methylococcus sp. EFPC2]|uniref:hypothetical protein n=1 Tax=Methylococcus sp. EFPC2 TaxID=2812648 RepID=UPI001967B789|nr:hypothetical protein [Methylococcus sp. EFPC2]QSA97376.1 hypothetical protein JWZ97_00550 [Methylococcus sp. EFPC2]